MLKVKTEYKPASRLLIAPSDSTSKVVEQKTLNVGAKSKVALSTTSVLMAVMGGVVKGLIELPGLVEFVVFQVWLLSCMLSIIFIWQGVTTKKLYVYDSHSNLRDEAHELLRAMKDVDDAKKLYPESSGYMARCDQFQKLAFEMIDALIVMKTTNVGRATNATKHELINRLQNQASNLARSGVDLADLMAIKRAENVVTDAGFLGVAEFMDDINVEMMTYRALAPGPVVEPQEDKKTAPKSGSKGPKPKSGTTTKKHVISQPETDKIIEDALAAVKEARDIQGALRPIQGRKITDTDKVQALIKQSEALEYQVMSTHISYEHKFSGWKKHCNECEKYNICKCADCKIYS